MAQLSVTEPLVKFVGSLLLLITALLLVRNSPSNPKVPKAWVNLLQQRGADAFVAEAERARAVFARWNKPIPMMQHKNAQLPILHPARRYKVTARIAALPNVHPRGEVVHELSFFVIRADVTPHLNDAVVSCLCAATGTTRDQWGLFNAEQFAADRTQLEYFVSAPANVAGGLIRNVQSYSVSKALYLCVRNSSTTFGAGATIHYARRVTLAPHVRDGLIGEEPWVIAALFFMVTLVLLEAVVLMRLRARRKKLKALKARTNVR